MRARARVRRLVIVKYNTMTLPLVTDGTGFRLDWSRALNGTVAVLFTRCVSTERSRFGAELGHYATVNSDDVHVLFWLLLLLFVVIFQQFLDSRH